MIAEFPNGMTMIIASSTVSEFGLQEVIRGHHARIEMGGTASGRIELKPERDFTDEIEPQEFKDLLPVEGLPPHEKNWFDSIRSGKEPNANIDLAVRVQSVISLSEMSERMNVMCLFDEKTRKITTGDGREIKPLTYGTMELS